MAKRSRKLSTRRPRRSKSSSRKTMKRTKRQPSKKSTLKKHSSKKRTLKKHSSKKRKSRTKSVRKRKKTKKVMKGGVTYKPVLVEGAVLTENIQQFDNATAVILIQSEESGTWLIRKSRRQDQLYVINRFNGDQVEMYGIKKNDNGKYVLSKNPTEFNTLQELFRTTPHLFSPSKELKDTLPKEKEAATYDEVVNTYNADENVIKATYKMTKVIEGAITYLMSVNPDFLLWFQDESPVEWTKEKRFAQIKTEHEEEAQFYLLFMSKNGQIKAVFKIKLDENGKISESTTLIQKVPSKFFGFSMAKPKRLTVKEIVDFIKKDTFTADKSAVTAAKIGEQIKIQQAADAEAAAVAAAAEAAAASAAEAAAPFDGKAFFQKRRKQKSIAADAAASVAAAAVAAAPPLQPRQSGSNYGVIPENCGSKQTLSDVETNPIEVADLETNINLMAQDSGKQFIEEYAEIEKGNEFTREASQEFANKHKNRYVNIVPYDYTRVQLTRRPEDVYSDYINACYIDGYGTTRQKHYIAAQGPTPKTVPDFWQMIVEQKVPVIAMVTNCEEKGRNKCEKYWPDIVNVEMPLSETSETFNVMMTHEDDESADYTIRTLDVQLEGTKHTVKQFHFKTWPDHGVPDNSTAMLEMLSKCNAARAAAAGPMVVHCSAGVGRTGTFIATDINIDMIEAKRNIDVKGTLNKMRRQRSTVVQTDAQYMFIYSTLLEYFTNNQGLLNTEEEEAF